MVPSVFVELEALPLNVNGKIDRKALPAPAVEPRQFRAPETPVEKAVARAFADALGVDDVGLDDEFFDLGGNSLVAVTVVAALRDALGVPLPLQWMFVEPTVESIAARIESGAHADADRSDDETAGLGVVLPLRASGTSEPLFCLHPVTGLSWSFAGLAGYVDEDRPIYGIQSPALSEDVDFPASIEEWAALYVDRIRRIQPSGPYHLVGWSLGGSIAHAMAVQLRDMGETVQTLAMLDSHVADPETGVAEHEDPSLADLLGDFAAELAGGDVALRQLDPERVDTILRRLPAPFDRITGADWERIVESIAHSFGLLDRYRPGDFDGDLLYFSADMGEADGAAGWRDSVGGSVEVVPVAAGHRQLLSPTALEVVGPALDRYLRR